MAMSDAHKLALAEGRRQSPPIKRYLEAMGGRRPGRPVKPETLRKRIAGLEEKIAAAKDPLQTLQLRQSRIDAERALADAAAKVDTDELEAEFVANAKGYSERKGISYSAWREAGVSAAVLKKAGIGRGA